MQDEIDWIGLGDTKTTKTKQQKQNNKKTKQQKNKKTGTIPCSPIEYGR
jgi:hypothetical protein